MLDASSLHAQGMALPQTAATESVVIAKNTTADFRQRFYEGLLKWSILKNISLPLTDADNAYDFRGSFWPMELILYHTDYARERLKYAFSMVDRQNADFQRALVEVVYTNFPTAFRPEVIRLMQRTTNAKVFAICANYLWRGGTTPDALPAILEGLRSRFDTARDNPVIMMLKADLGRARHAPPPLPDLRDLLGLQFAPGLPVLYSFQRRNRDYPGMVVVRGPDGRFVRNGDGSVFAVPQLARSISNLPFYLTNGNTPQGVYRMSGFAVSRSQFIGPTQNIQLSLPYEIPVDSFVINYIGADSCWQKEAYHDLLPASWQSYLPVYDAFYAGKAGRSAIIAHGTTIDPSFYKGQVYYPQTPSEGCLCALETWSPADGSRTSSYQQQLVDALKSTGSPVGYAVVIELDDKAGPVQLNELLPFIRRAENTGAAAP
ncbi:hypothetical protein GCM10023143_08260 [Compostibacter hankyongensis]|uniref:Uncharacterized protein n=2 Tax=Compostibacter hankyongensis TaxID=1007089 RepID=A0ABP8FIB4_9BACT